MARNLKHSRPHQDNWKIVNRQESNNRIVRKKPMKINTISVVVSHFTWILLEGHYSISQISMTFFFSQKFTINTCELKQGQVFSCPRGRGHQQAQIRDGGKHWDKVKSCFHHCQFPWFVAGRHSWLLLCGSFYTSWAETPQCYSACHLDVTNLPSCR